MLKSLFIQNYALIHELELDFHPGLTIISGETGAGKSILLGALSLVLGQRADTQVLLDQSKKCIVEGIFDITKNDLKDFFLQNDLDYDPQTTLRREINTAGKSSAFINDTPVNLNVLRDLGIQLVDIHSQHQNILLGKNTFQLQVVDTFSGNDRLLHDYRYEYKQFRKLESEYEQLRDTAEKNRSDQDYYQFQLDQLLKAHLREGEQKDLESESEMLTHSEEISNALRKIHHILSEDENDLLSRLKEVRTQLEKVMEFYPVSREWRERLSSLEIELKDLASEIEASGTELEHEPGRLEFVRERLSLLYSLEQKHNVETVEELIGIQHDLEKRIEGISNQDEQLHHLKKLLDEKGALLEKMAEKLSESRKEIIPKIEKEIIQLLQQLGMPNAQFRVEHTALPELTPQGKDMVDFLFSANKHTDLQDLKRIASGGELSRVMLSLKSLLVRSLSMPTIIFDEIDAGVSGDIADRVGEIIHTMSDTIQVVNITHLPQIASKGGRHFLVYKTEGDEATHTHVRLLNQQERVMEIAKMLSGKELTDAAVENARTLLSHMQN